MTKITAGALYALSAGIAVAGVSVLANHGPWSLGASMLFWGAAGAVCAAYGLPRMERIYERNATKGEVMVEGRLDMHGRRAKPYMTRFIWGSARLHIFWRGDADPDPHDHPFDFYTFPLNKRGYYEEYLHTSCHPEGEWYDKYYPPGVEYRRERLIPGRKWTWVHAEHAHRVLWPATADAGFFRCDVHKIREDARAAQACWPIVTLVWASPKRREWGFHTRKGWRPWKEYVYG